MIKETSSSLPLWKTRHDLEWLHHAFTVEKHPEAKAVDTERASDDQRSVAVWELDGDKRVTVDFRKFYEADPLDQIEIVKRGVNARLVDVLATSMHIPKEKLIDTLGLTRTTIQRKSRQQKALSSDESSRVVGLSKLIGQVQAMVQESGAPEDFDAAAWLAQWLDQSLPALNGECPGDLMDTAEGQAMVSQLLGRLQSAAYA